MSKMNSMLMGICFLLSSLFSCQQSKGDFKTVPVEEFASLIEDASVQRLDVRTMAEYSEGHIPGTININVLDDSFAVMADSTLQKDKPVALYCRSGKRSKKAAAILSEKGYKVYELDKGFNAWQEAGEKVENPTLNLPGSMIRPSMKLLSASAMITPSGMPIPMA